MENVAMIFVMGAICGISIYRGFATLLGARTVGYSCLGRQNICVCNFSLCLLEDAANIKTTKQKIIEKLGHSENVIKLTRNEDAYNLSTWKREAINRLIERYPPSYKRIVHYRNWNEAMNYFEKQRKNICNLNE